MLSATALSTPLVSSLTIWYIGLRRLLKQNMNVVPPSLDRVMVGTARGNKSDTNLIRAVGTVIGKLPDTVLPLQTQTSQLGTPLEGTTTTRVGEEVPPQEVVTPRLSKEMIKNDKYFHYVQTQDLGNIVHFA